MSGTSKTPDSAVLLCCRLAGMGLRNVGGLDYGQIPNMRDRDRKAEYAGLQIIEALVGGNLSLTDASLAKPLFQLVPVLSVRLEIPGEFFPLNRVRSRISTKSPPKAGAHAAKTSAGVEDQPQQGGVVHGS